MDPGWAGVIGAAIGAAIGGLVTLGSLWIKGRQDHAARVAQIERDDEIREQDRSRSVHQQNIEQRRVLYANLLSSAADLTLAVDRLVLLLKSEDRRG
jgi:hypothetical protein